MDRARHAERAVTVAARALELDVVALAPHRAIDDVQPEPVYGNEVVDLSLVPGREELSHAAKVSFALLADVADENHFPVRLDLSLVERLGHGEHDGKAATVIADSRRRELVAVALHLHVGSLGKHGVEVTGEHDGRPVSGACTLGDYIPSSVDSCVRIAERDETLLELRGTRLLLEVGRGDLADGDLLIEHPRIRRLDAVERAFHLRLVRRNGERALSGKDRRNEAEAKQCVPRAERVHIRRWT